MTREQLKDYHRWYSVGADGCENDYSLLWVLPTDQYERLNQTDNSLITKGIEDDSIYYVYYSPSDREADIMLSISIGSMRLTTVMVAIEGPSLRQSCHSSVLLNVEWI